MKTVTITSQGQITIPASFRRLMNIDVSDELNISYDKQAQQLVIKKVMSLDEITAFAMSKIDPSVKPLEDVHKFYYEDRYKND